MCYCHKTHPGAPTAGRTIRLSLFPTSPHPVTPSWLDMFLPPWLPVSGSISQFPSFFWAFFEAGIQWMLSTFNSSELFSRYWIKFPSHPLPSSFPVAPPFQHLPGATSSLPFLDTHCPLPPILGWSNHLACPPLVLHLYTDSIFFP